MIRHLPIATLLALTSLAVATVVAPATQAQTPADDGQEGAQETEDDGWGNEQPAPAEEPAPTQPTPADEPADDGWGTPAPAAAPKPSPGDEAPAAAPEPSPGDEAPASDPEPTPEPAAAPPPPKPQPLPTPPPGLAPGAKLAFTAGALIDRGQFSAAEAKASLATITPGGAAPGQMQLARLRLRQGRVREALQAARDALNRDEVYSPARLLLIRLMLAQGERVEPQISIVERLTQRFPDDLGLAVALGETQLAAKRHAAAMRTARSVLKRAETSVTAMKLLARAYFAVGNDSTTESILNTAVGLEEDAEACHLMAQVFLKRNNLVQARIWIDRSLKANPSYVEALNNLGVVFIKMRDFPAALEILPRVTQLAPGFGAAWLNLGIAQRGGKRFTAAETSWKEVLRVAPRMSEAWFNLGILYLENDMPGLALDVRLSQAVDAFNRYRHGARVQGTLDRSVDAHIAEAVRLIDQEKKRKQKALKKPQAKEDDWGDNGGDEGGDEGDDEGGGGDDDW